MSLPRAGYVINDWLIKRVVTSNSGETLYLLACLGCGRGFNASLKQLENIGRCAACFHANDAESEKPTRIPLHIRGWKQL